MLQFDYPGLLAHLAPYLAPKRNESASFLIWYLVNYYRLDELDATDAVCDQKGDKGVDGIYVNEGTGTIDIFQSKINQKGKSTIGDTLLKEFAGTLTQFASKQSVENLLATAGDAQVARLVNDLDLLNLLGNYEVRGIFLSNSELDQNGAAFLKHAARIRFVGAKELQSTFVSDQKDTLKIGKAEFDISGFSAASYLVDATAKAIIVPIAAKELVKLKGIEDQSLFSLNVRASLGHTQVNRDIVKSIRNSDLHKKFPLFHNGITILAQKVDSTDDKIFVENYFVVNGCQSLNALYEHQSELTDNLRLLTKFIQVEANSSLSEIITSYSNNQNGVKPRDFKSNHPIQTRLQNEIRARYADQYDFEIKRGEPLKSGRVITNENAGLNLVAFDLKEPWSTHRKYQLFEDKHAEVFGRPNVTADRLVLCDTLIDQIENRLDNLENKLIAKYVLTKYVLLYTLRRVFEADDLGREMLQAPEKFVREAKRRNAFAQLIGELLDGLVIDLNLETIDLADDFDYRNKLRDKEYVAKLTAELLASYQKDIKRKKMKPLADAWKASF